MNFSMELCPMLIGIKRGFSKENNSYSSIQYESKLLLIGDDLVQTFQQLNLETLLDQLITFKVECDENEQSFVRISYVIIRRFIIHFILGI